MKKVLLKFEKSGYDNVIRFHTENFQQKLNKLVSLYNGLGFGDLTTEDLGLLMDKPKSFLFKKIVGDSQSIPMIPEKGYDIIEKPAEAFEIVEIIEEIHKPIPNNGAGSYSFEQKCWILKDGKVILCEEWSTKLKTSYQVFTENEKQEEALEALIALEKALNDFRNFCLIDVSNFKEFFPGSSIVTCSSEFVFKADITQIQRVKERGKNV